MTNDALVPIDNSFDDKTRIQVPFDETQPLLLSVTNAHGDVTIVPADRPDLSITAVRTDGGAFDPGNPQRIDVKVHGNKVSVHPNWQLNSTINDLFGRVKTQLKDGFKAEDWDFKKMKIGRDLAFDIHIEVPRSLADGSRVATRVASGDVDASDLNADVSVTSASGDITLTRLNGRSSAHTANGDITMSTITGTLEANTANGDITVRNGEAWTAIRAVNGDINITGLTMKNARVTTVSGDISVDAIVNNTSAYSFDTVSGDISLTTSLPPTGASLNYRALSGDTRITGDWTAASGKRNWQLAAGSDGPEIRVKAVSGDLIAIARADPTVTLIKEEMPRSAQPDVDAGNATTDVSIRDDIGQGDVENPQGSPSADVDWDKARGWVKDLTQRISRAVSDIDEAGERRHRGSSFPSDDTGPIHPNARASNADTQPSVTPPAPPAHPHAESPTEPLATKQPEAPWNVPDATETSPLPPAGVNETPEAKRLRLLEAVQRGEMTVDDALAQMDGDESTS